ncbi:thermonuclease family protein [Bacillus xiapuensis]|uniref:thermonuclease family protein n=1 Tax=Bacillus xiapuensis TaxID=2014075 RepID=UPI000C241138|nr:thermonuclease family protein [Bacillus xiapuensis]
MTNQKGCIGCLGALILIAIVFFAIVINHLLTAEAPKEDTVEEEQTQTASAPEKTPSTKSNTGTPSVPGAKVNGRLIATVLSIVDGDTIKVNLDGKEETIRLVLVDTPETKHPRTGVQPFGPEASKFTTKQLSGKEIQVEPGIQERDRYGRLLAYVYIRDKMFNKILLEKGLARVAVYPPNTKYLDEFEKIQAAAKRKKVGIWSIENYATKDGYKTKEKEQKAPAPKPALKAEPKPEPQLKKENVYFKNCAAVRAAGAAPIHRGEPGYGSHLDREGDGIACE